MKLTIPFFPVAQARPRIFQRGGNIKAYDPSHKEKVTFGWLLREALGKYQGRPFALPVETSLAIKVWHYLPPPLSSTREELNAKLWHLDDPSHKPDIDNLDKFILDACNGILWKDDALIVSLESHKLYSLDPKIVIEFMPKEILPSKIKKILATFSPEELKEFISDSLIFSEIHCHHDGGFPGDMENIWYSTTATRLSNFSLKYGDKLQKIKKIGDISECASTTNLKD